MKESNSSSFGLGPRLFGQLERICSEAALPWIKARHQAIVGGDRTELQILFSAAGRRLSKAAAGVPVEATNTSHWSVADLGRVAALIVILERLPLTEHEALVADLYFRGSADEKRGVLLSLPLLPGPQRWCELAVEACRSNTVTVFAAIACENAFPALYFSEEQIIQLILKTMFLDLEVARIDQLLTRVTPTLLENLEDFRSEREAAGRTVPPGLTWIIQKSKEL